MTTPSTYVVAVPFHSGVGHLRVALDSLIGQRDADWRAIVVDDAPDDSSSRACAGVVADLDDQRIEYLRPPNRSGVAGAFNRCFELARERGATHVTVLHADDALEPWYLDEVRRAHLSDPDAAAVCTAVVVIDADGRTTWPIADRVKRRMWRRAPASLSGEGGLTRLMHGQFLYCPATSFRLEAFPSPAWDDRWRQVMDLALYSQALIGGSRIALVHRPSYRYRRHGASATQQNSTSAVRIGEESALCREVGDAARASGWRRASWAARARVTVRLHGLVQVLQQLARLQWRSAARTLGHAVGP